MTTATATARRRAGVASVQEAGMEYDRDKVDEMILVLFWLTLAGDHRVWKSHSAQRRAIPRPGIEPESAPGPATFCSITTEKLPD